MYSKGRNKYEEEVNADIVNCGCVVGFLIILAIILWRIFG